MNSKPYFSKYLNRCPSSVPTMPVCFYMQKNPVSASGIITNNLAYENCIMIDSNQLFTDSYFNENGFHRSLSPGASKFKTEICDSFKCIPNLNELSAYLNECYCVCDQKLNYFTGNYEDFKNGRHCVSVSPSGGVMKDSCNSLMPIKSMCNTMPMNNMCDYEDYFNNKKSMTNKFFTEELKNNDLINEDEEEKDPELSNFSNQNIGNIGGNNNNKRKLYFLRQDVIAKIIFRSLRKYYLKDFKSFYNFSKCRSDQNSDTHGEMIRQVNRYLVTKFGYTRYQNLPIFLLAIMDIKEKFLRIGIHLKSLKESITALLYSYNKIKMVNIVKNPEFAMLLLHFLNQRDVLQQIIKHRGNQDLIMAYTEQIQCFKSMCALAMRE